MYPTSLFVCSYALNCYGHQYISRTVTPVRLIPCFFTLTNLILSNNGKVDIAESDKYAIENRSVFVSTPRVPQLLQDCIQYALASQTTQQQQNCMQVNPCSTYSMLYNRIMAADINITNINHTIKNLRHIDSYASVLNPSCLPP